MVTLQKRFCEGLVANVLARQDGSALGGYEREIDFLIQGHWGGPETSMRINPTAVGSSRDLHIYEYRILARDRSKPGVPARSVGP